MASQGLPFGNVDIASFSAKLALLSSGQATISGNLTVLGTSTSSAPALVVLGNTQLSNTSIGGGLQVGFLHFDDMKAEISALTGLVTINNNLNVMGDATVSGQLKVGKGIVLPDTITGEDYCVQVTNGEIVKTKGECN